MHDSFWNCFEEVATDNMQNDEDVEKSSIAHEIDFHLKNWANSYKWRSTNAKQYSSLTKLAKIYLSSSDSSVHSKRPFSQTCIVYE